MKLTTTSSTGGGPHYYWQEFCWQVATRAAAMKSILKLALLMAQNKMSRKSLKGSKEKYGLDVELVGFSGSLLPNDATNHGELDANVFQHRPFLEQDNQAHGYKLVAVGNTFVFPMAGYSKKNQNSGANKRRCDSGDPQRPD